MVHVQHDDGRRYGVAGDELLEEPLATQSIPLTVAAFSGREKVEALARSVAPSSGGRSNPVLNTASRRGLGVFAVLVGTGDLIHSLSKEIV